MNPQNSHDGKCYGYFAFLGCLNFLKKEIEIFYKIKYQLIAYKYISALINFVI